MEIRPTEPTEAVKALLVASALPIDDIDDQSITLFACCDGPSVLGVVGLQQLDGCALLRSLAVEPRMRAQGLGVRLCDAAGREAESRGCAELWLLTTSASGYFERRGFVAVARDAIPASVRATAQFSALCPSSAVVMMRVIA